MNYQDISAEHFFPIIISLLYLMRENSFRQLWVFGLFFFFWLLLYIIRNTSHWVSQESAKIT